MAIILLATPAAAIHQNHFRPCEIDHHQISDGRRRHSPGKKVPLGVNESLSIHDLFMLTSIGTRGHRAPRSKRKVDNFFCRV